MIKIAKIEKLKPKEVYDIVEKKIIKERRGHYYVHLKDKKAEAQKGWLINGKVSMKQPNEKISDSNKCSAVLESDWRRPLL